MVLRNFIAATLVAFSPAVLAGCGSSSGFKDPDLSGSWAITLRPDGGSPFGSLAYLQHKNSATSMNTADAHDRFEIKFSLNATGAGATGYGFQRTGFIEFKNNSSSCIIGRATGSFKNASSYRGTYKIDRCGQGIVTGIIEMDRQ